MCQQTPDAAKVYDQAWWDPMGDNLHASNPVSHIQTGQFQDLLGIRGIHQDQFPMKVEHQSGAEEEISLQWDLRDWVVNISP